MPNRNKAEESSEGDESHSEAEAQSDEEEPEEEKNEQPDNDRIINNEKFEVITQAEKKLIEKQQQFER